jgi:hypothetical protein
MAGNDFAPILDWTPAHSAGFRREPLVVRHRLGEAGLSDEAVLANVLETHPDALCDVNLYDFRPDGSCITRTGTRAGKSGAELLAAVKAGRLWINLRSVQTRDDRFGAMIGQVFDELAHAMPGFHARKTQGNLLLSGPSAKVPFHADPPDVFLFHLIGRKRIWIYPNTTAFVPDDVMESIVIGAATEDLPYLAEFDSSARIYDLEPGQAVAWPTNAPHRVENLGTFNASLSIEYRDWTTRFKEGAYYFNGTMRRHFGIRPTPVENIGSTGRMVRWACGQVLKRAGVNRRLEKSHAVEFDMTKTNA